MVFWGLNSIISRITILIPPLPLTSPSVGRLRSCEAVVFAWRSGLLLWEALSRPKGRWRVEGDLDSPEVLTPCLLGRAVMWQCLNQVALYLITPRNSGWSCEWHLKSQEHPASWRVGPWRGGVGKWMLDLDFSLCLFTWEWVCIATIVCVSENLNFSILVE